jgi:hypothetical protein
MDEYRSLAAAGVARRSTLEFIAGQLSRLPTRGDLAKAALGIIISTAALVILWAEAFWRV